MRTNQRYGSKFPIARCSVEELPLKRNYFDIVIALDLIEHLYYPDHMLSAVRRVLRNDGRLIITTDRAGYWLGSSLEIWKSFFRRMDFHRAVVQNRSKYRTQRRMFIDSDNIRCCLWLERVCQTDKYSATICTPLAGHAP